MKNTTTVTNTPTYQPVSGEVTSLSTGALTVEDPLASSKQFFTSSEKCCKTDNKDRPIIHWANQPFTDELLEYTIAHPCCDDAYVRIWDDPILSKEQSLVNFDRPLTFSIQYQEGLRVGAVICKYDNMPTRFLRGNVSKQKDHIDIYGYWFRFIYSDKIVTLGGKESQGCKILCTYDTVEVFAYSLEPEVRYNDPDFIYHVQ